VWARWRGPAFRLQRVCFADKTRGDQIHARVMVIVAARAAPAARRAAASAVHHAVAAVHAVAVVHAVAAGVVVVEDDDRA